MNTIKMLLCTGFLVLGLLGTTNAALIKKDFNSGDNLLTLDTDTGLSWLNIGETYNMSYNAVLTTDYIVHHGFRVATYAEVEELWYNQGGDVPNGYTSYAGGKAALELMTNLGYQYKQPQSTDPRTMIYMLTGNTSTWATDKYGTGRQGVQIINYHEGYNNSYHGRLGNVAFNIDDEKNSYGFFLVKSTPVPIPGAAWLMGSGLLGLVGFRKKLTT